MNMKNNVYMCTTESFHSTAEISTELLINYASIKKWTAEIQEILVALIGTFSSTQKL